MKKQFLLGFIIPFVMSACSDEDRINSEMNVMQEETIHSSGIDVSQKQTRLAYAPIIEYVSSSRMVTLRTYNTGHVIFGITVK